MDLEGTSRFPADTAEAPVLLCSVSTGTTASVLHLDGELDIDSAALLTGVVDGQVASGRVDVRLDLAGLTFCDVRGLDALLGAQQRLRSSGGRLVVLHPSDFLRTVAGLCGAGGLFDPVR